MRLTNPCDHAWGLSALGLLHLVSCDEVLSPAGSAALPLWQSEFAAAPTVRTGKLVGGTGGWPGGLGGVRFQSGGEQGYTAGTSEKADLDYNILTNDPWRFRSCWGLRAAITSATSTTGTAPCTSQSRTAAAPRRPSWCATR
jgi:hypothetical protein